MEAVPLLTLHIAGVDVTVDVIALGCVMLNVCVILQVGVPDEMVTVYVPGHNPEAEAPVPPDGAQLYVYTPVPPLAVTLAAPVHCPLHNTLVCVPVAVIGGGCVILKVCDAVQPAVFEIVHVYVPAHNADAVAALPPEGAQA